MRIESEQAIELDILADMLARPFIQRRDLYARQLEDGSYLCVRKPLQDRLLIAHLKGEITLGAYVLDQESRARFAVIDADDDLQLARLAEMGASLAAAGIPSYLETSRRGGHQWFFFEEPIPGKEARAFGTSLLKSNGLLGIELFPKQDKLGDGPGSLIRLPFGIHRKTGRRYGFVTPQGVPLAATLAEQIQVLTKPETIGKRVLEGILKADVSSSPSPSFIKSKANGETLSERIKRSVPVLDFVRQYVSLSPSGRGKCPFHDDQHASFSVDVNKNYWHCFAGCGGGSLIDFWMKYKQVDFKQAVHELSEMLLEA